MAEFLKELRAFKKQLQVEREKLKPNMQAVVITTFFDFEDKLERIIAIYQILDGKRRNNYGNSASGIHPETWKKNSCDNHH